MGLHYDCIRELSYDTNCVSSNTRWLEKHMEGMKRANKRKIHSLLKRLLPEVYDSLALWCYNPYNYYYTNEHIIVVHSSIEHFIKYRYL